MTRTEARRLFPERFRKAMQQKGMKQVELGRLLGVRGTTVSEWSRGIRFPSMGQAPGLVEHLETDSLTFLIAAGHTVACEVCGREVTQTKRTRLPRYCSRLCKSTSHSRAERAGRAHEGVIAKHRLAVIQQAVNDFCRDCTAGESVCRDNACRLRAHSPYPFIAINRRVA
jgi:transcriptional regulator with XRE-family HTH domain